jgi:type VI secretion system ImpA family protein
MPTNRPKLLTDALLAAIPGGKPSGEWLRYDGSTYDKIQEARREDEAYLDQGVWQTSLKKADWFTVQKLCSEVLSKKTKDLQIAVWLMEAWTVQHGMYGALEGVRYLKELCLQYWDDLYPALDGDDVDYRIAPLIWLNEKFSPRFRILQLTKPRSRDIDAYLWSDWDDILAWENLVRKNPDLQHKPESASKLTRDIFRYSMMDTPIEHYLLLAEDCDKLFEELTALTVFLDEKCGRQSPSFSQFRDTPTRIRRYTAEVLKDRSFEIPVESTEEPAQAQAAAQTANNSSTEGKDMIFPRGNQAAPGEIQSREDAYRRLAEAADYLLKHEPHSPVPYLVRRAISWGTMSLPELIMQIVNTQDDRMSIFTLLGLNQNPEAQSLLQDQNTSSYNDGW